MKIENTFIKGLKVIHTFHFQDERGSFEKIFNAVVFKKWGMTFDFKELFYSTSKRNVIRGMHFQLPPFDHEKLVFVLKGKILDVCVDLRKNSSTYGKYFYINLDEDTPVALYIPKGLAHGFRGLSDENIVFYLTTSVYSKEHDSGIRWNSFGFDWNCKEPIISERDKNFLPLAEFKSPF